MKHESTRTTRTIAGLLLATLAFIHAEDTEILLDDTTLGASIESGDSVTSNGLTMTVSNVVASDGGNTGDVEGVGILFGPVSSFTDVVSLQVSFNSDVRITGYIIGGREDVPSGAKLTVSGPNGISDPNPIPEISGSTQTEIKLPFLTGDLIVLKAGQPYTISHNLDELAGGDPLFNLEALLVAPAHVSIQFQEGMIHLEHVGILQELNESGDWEDLDPQPPNSWVFSPSGGVRIFRARK